MLIIQTGKNHSYYSGLLLHFSNPNSLDELNQKNRTAIKIHIFYAVLVSLIGFGFRLILPGDVSWIAIEFIFPIGMGIFTYLFFSLIRMKAFNKAKRNFINKQNGQASSLR